MEKIDTLSKAASEFAIPNEYDKVVNYIGATGTNAYTSNERTVYVNTIPSTQLKLWLELENERFSNPVFRLFHTELEVVFEEMNKYLGNESAQSYMNLLDKLFPSHPYGQRSTIGTQEHLKHPSLKKIKEYYDKYYVSNNMAICLVGDIEYDETIKLISKIWENYRIGEKIDNYNKNRENKIISPIREKIYGLEPDIIFMGYRLNGSKTENILYLELLNSLLYNGVVGLIDKNLISKQKLFNVYVSPIVFRDYSVHLFIAMSPGILDTRGIEYVFNIEIKRIQAGDFSDELFESVKLNKIIEIERNKKNRLSKIDDIVDSFIVDKKINYYTNKRNMKI